MAAWLAAAGQGSLHTLPLGERAGDERSPYSALTAFAIDPVYVGVDAVEDFVAAGGRSSLAPAEREALDRLRERPAMDYGGVRALKRAALSRGFDHFERTELAGDSGRARRFVEFEATERSWLEPYTLFRALHERGGEATWLGWEAGLRDARPDACGDAGRALARVRRRLAWTQWIAHDQLAAARRVAAACGVALIGDLPFTVAIDSADVWSHQHEFDVGVTIGAPPDAFDAQGQDWALPAYRWDVVRANGHAWLGERLAHVGRWLDGARLDHVVGYFRTFVRPPGGEPHFEPREPAAQRDLGAAALDVARRAADRMWVIAEDLGDVPSFVRDEMAARDLPGYRVLRWEHDDGRFRDPAAFPACSIAAAGTHDTSTLAAWWSDELAGDEQHRLTDVPLYAALRDAGRAFTPEVHERLVDVLYAAGSDAALLVVPDVFGSRERINTPATVGDHNWSYRLPFALEELAGAAGGARAAWLAGLARRHGRAA